MVITFDDQFLLTVSEDGCLLMWKIIDKEGRGLKSNRQIIHTEEILVTKSDLEEKVCVCLHRAILLAYMSTFSTRQPTIATATAPEIPQCFSLV